jgi:hypothetical protein
MTELEPALIFLAPFQHLPNDFVLFGASTRLDTFPLYRGLLSVMGSLLGRTST